ncbi:MAG: STAS domain-containing protein [Solirubrobacterales bacterium]|nr:STAS domain-containing protein [Solirubrobacterales bacterium]
MSTGAVHFDPRGNVLVAQMSGEIDLTNAEQLGIQVAEATPPDALAVVLDLTAVEYLDSYGIFVIHGLRARLGEHQQRLVLVVPKDGIIRRAVDLVALAEVVPVKDELEDALQVAREFGR